MSFSAFPLCLSVSAVSLFFFLAALPPLHAQDTLAQLEARARDLKSRGDAAGSLAASIAFFLVSNLAV